MKKTLVFLCGCFLFVAFILVGTTFSTSVANAATTNKSFIIDNFTIHNLEDNTGYYPTNENKVNIFTSGHSRLGCLKVVGDVAKKTYNGYEAYAVYGGGIKFQYNQTWSDKTNNGKNWKLSADSATSINGVSTGTIGSGGFVIMKSTDNCKTWVKTGACSVDINGDEISFTPDGSDVKGGVFYKFISVCEAYYTYTYQNGTKTVYPSYLDAPWYIQILSPASVGVWILANGHQEPVYASDNHYENYAQVSIVYVASDSCEVGFYGKSTDEYDAVENFKDVSVDTLEILKKGITLTDNSISLNQIRVDKLGNTSFDVTCSYNNSAYSTVKDKEIFTKPGHYQFRITTKFLTQKEVNLWILDIKDDYAYSQYFGEGFVSQSCRIFDKNSSIPVYMVGTTLNISPNKYVPRLNGKILRFKDINAVESNNSEVLYTFDKQISIMSLELNDTGIYCADFYVGNIEASGDVIHYVFYFSVEDNKDYKPTLNYEMLTSADRRLALQTSGYAVNFPTAGGGSYIFMFPSTQEGYESALEFSERIEYRFIEEFDNGSSKYYYYKGHGTAGLKQRFDSKVELFAAISFYAKANVNLIYSNNSEAYATMTFDEAVANIEKTSISSDLKVCIDAATREQFVAQDIILNGYKFYQAAEYETENVIATDENGTVYNIPFNTDIETILPKSGRYLISESNWHATNKYYTNFIAPCDVTGSIEYIAYKDDSEFIGKMDLKTNEIIEANAFRLVNAKDELDSQSILTVAYNGNRTNMLLSEVHGYLLNEPGIYNVTITNRCGYFATITLNITKNEKKTSENEEDNQNDYKYADNFKPDNFEYKANSVNIKKELMQESDLSQHAGNSNFLVIVILVVGIGVILMLAGKTIIKAIRKY